MPYTHNTPPPPPCITFQKYWPQALPHCIHRHGNILHRVNTGVHAEWLQAMTKYYWNGEKILSIIFSTNRMEYLWRLCYLYMDKYLSTPLNNLFNKPPILICWAVLINALHTEFILENIKIFLNPINPYPPSAEYMRQWIRSALVQIMAYRAEPSSKPMLGYCQLDS